MHPFILGAQEILVAYVGIEYQHLTIWLIMWCVTVLIQIHTTPGNSLVFWLMGKLGYWYVLLQLLALFLCL